MIISRITGGLGNQMFQYAVGKAIAIKYNDILKMDITTYDKNNIHNGYRLNIFNINEQIASKKEIKSLKRWNILNKLKLYTRNKVYDEKERTIYDEDIFNYKNIYLKEYWQNEKYFLSIKDILLKEFSLKMDMYETIQNQYKYIRDTNSISIHVKRGDYAKHPEIGILDIDYYKGAVTYIRSKIENPIFYIFSNDINWCKSNFNFIKDKIFIENTKNEIDDLFLMKNCHHNIIANSSFSWWAAWLNENKQKIIISPKKWMVKNPNNYKWTPNSWIEI